MYRVSYNQFTNQTNHIFPLFTTEYCTYTTVILHCHEMRPLHTVNYAGSCGWLLLQASKSASTAHSQSVHTLAVKLFHGFTLNLALQSFCLFANLINCTGRSQHRQLRSRVMSLNAKFVMSLLSRHTIQIKLQPHKACVNTKQGEYAALCGNDYKHVQTGMWV